MKVQVENLKAEWANISGKLSPELAKEYDSDLIEGLEYYKTDKICKKTIDLFVELCNAQLAKQENVGDKPKPNANIGLMKMKAKALALYAYAQNVK